MLIIPFRSLSQEALYGVLDEYIGREGTDYGMAQQTLAQKRLRLLDQLESGQAVISYDPISETTSLIPGAEVDN